MGGAAAAAPGSAWSHLDVAAAAPHGPPTPTGVSPRRQVLPARRAGNGDRRELLGVARVQEHDHEFGCSASTNLPGHSSGRLGQLVLQPAGHQDRHATAVVSRRPETPERLSTRPEPLSHTAPSHREDGPCSTRMTSNARQTLTQRAAQHHRLINPQVNRSWSISPVRPRPPNSDLVCRSEISKNIRMEERRKPQRSTTQSLARIGPSNERSLREGRWSMALPDDPDP